MYDIVDGLKVDSNTFARCQGNKDEDRRQIKNIMNFCRAYGRLPHAANIQLAW
eukprot:CAMPEP_0169287222 /NCGR_PEP_ID=MMETSP1016-20121227/59769_1 /TAXON_ID=342587 /ORGANISM="Karlodinium micrum, Strain CCMP2283" /LENGTH=52 /DNA_ID=CAMNT_0009377087 /DNA_START=23 /DNA_END=178 /DNA_ORIENTATION=-